MDQDVRDAEPAPVQLHLHRGIGWGLYGTGTVLVAALVVFGVAHNLGTGRYVMAVLIAGPGLALTAFLVIVTRAMVLPGLTATATGIRGRMPEGAAVDAGWDEITLDVDDHGEPGALRLRIGPESASVNERSWIGFGPFVVLIASTPAAAARLTPAARQEVLRLLRIGG